MRKNLSIFLSIFIFAFTLLSQNIYAASEDISIDYLKTLPKNSIQRYAYSKALENNTAYDYELKKAKDACVPLSIDEYIDYRTKEATAGTISTNLGTMYPYICSEARVVVNATNGRVVRVEDFGAPYADVYNQNATWTGGGFNIDRQNDTSARFSSTGQFFIDNGNLTVNYDIVSITSNLGGKTRVFTISTYINW